MTIPPIGSHTSPVVPPDEPQNGNNVKGAPSPDRPKSAEKPPGSEVVELSSDARRVRELQARITQLQVTERAAQRIKQQARDVADALDRLEAGARSGDRNRVEQARAQAEEALRNIEAARENATFEGQRVLGDNNDEYDLGKPQAAREVDRFVASARDAIRDRSSSRDERVSREMDRLASAAGRTRERLEKEVRDSVARAVKESTQSKPRDTAEAEKLVRQARENRADSDQRPRNIEQISHRAVRLLE
jgi:hypothetical protein